MEILHNPKVVLLSLHVSATLSCLQLANFEYFLAVGSHYPQLHSNMHWVFTVSGERCAPCTALYSVLPEWDHSDLSVLGIKEARFSSKFSLLIRTENVGMDLGGHNVTLEWLGYRGHLQHYKYFIFLNSSVKGPFLPPWLPPSGTGQPHTWQRSNQSRLRQMPRTPGLRHSPGTPRPTSSQPQQRRWCMRSAAASCASQQTMQGGQGRAWSHGPLHLMRWG